MRALLSKRWTTKRSHQVAEYFAELINQHVYRPGDKLPSLDEMARLLEVSKSTIREGLAVLVAQNLLDVRHGSGYFVKGSPDTQRAPVEPRDVGHVLSVRLFLEVPAARLAALNRSDDHLVRMERTLDIMRAGSVERAVDADLTFHLTIAEASRNPVLYQLVQTLAPLMKDTMQYSRAIAGTGQTLYTKHLALLSAIRDQDGKRAERLMRTHLSDTAGRLNVLLPDARAIWDNTRQDPMDID